MPDASTTHEFRRYADVLDPESPPPPAAADRAVALNPALAYTSALCEALDALAEVVAARLDAFAAFITLTDGTTQHLLAGSWRDKHASGDLHPSPTPHWLAPTPADSTAWLHLLRLSLRTNHDHDNRDDEDDDDHGKQRGPAGAGATRKPVTRRRLADDAHTAHLTCVAGAPHLRHFAAAPIVSARGIAVGVIFVVNTETRLRGGERQSQARMLQATAAKAMAQLETARAVRLRERMAIMHSRLKSFVMFKDIVAQTNEEPPAVHYHRRRRVGKDGREEVVVTSELHREQELGEADVDGTSELKFSDEGEAGALRRNHNNAEDPVSVSVGDEGEGEGGGKLNEGESTYRKVFARAAETLRAGLGVDGVAFLDGIVGFHSQTVPIGEAEIELENDMAAQSSADCRDDSDPELDMEGVDEEDTLRDGPAASRPSRPAASDDQDTRGGSERTFISTDYEKKVLVRRPAECLGIAVINNKWPVVNRVATGTVGLKHLDGDLLQRLLKRFPTGRMWYFGDEGTPYTFSPDDDSLVSAADDADILHILRSFPEVRQLFFAPLTDSTSRKRLAGCVAWTTRTTPLLTSAADLDVFRGFLSSVESEVSRIDAIAAVKQRESFVSSVSHELRTPLHGILGAVQFMADTDLDDFQSELAETIRCCGSTLHETLSSVLAYAKITQFERRRDMPVPRRTNTQPSPWAMEDKDVGRDTDNADRAFYCAADIATLCETVVEVTANGYVFSNAAAGAPSNDVSVVLDIAYRPSWGFITEPAVLRRIMSNIVGNSLKYTQRGFVHVSLRVDNTQDDRSQLGRPNDNRRMLLVFSVTDSGKGISKDFLQKHLFSPFTQENAVASDGVGLGMSIVKSMVGLLSGKISVSSKPDVGSTFTVVIPMQECVDDAPTSGPSAALAEALPEIQERRMAVAICGFDDMMHESLTRYFRDWFQWDVVSSAEDEQRSSRVDIIVVKGTRDVPMQSIRDRPHADVYIFVADLEKPELMHRRDSTAARNPDPIEVTTTRPIGPLKLCKAVSACLSRLAEVEQGKTTRDEDKASEESQLPAHETASITADGAELETTVPPSSSSRSKPASPSSSSPARPRPQPPPPTIITSCYSPTLSAADAVQGEVGQNPRFLLVEDNIVNLRLLQTFLQKQGYSRLTTAGNGKMAIDAVMELGEENRGFDIIFMDISMPVMDGFAATLAICNFERARGGCKGTSAVDVTPPLLSIRPPVYIISLTGLASIRDEQRAYAAGVDLVLTKPVKFVELKGILMRWEEGERVAGRARERLPDGEVQGGGKGRGGEEG